MKTKYLVFSVLLIVIVTLTLVFIYGERWAENKLKKKLAEIEHLTYDSLLIDLEENQITFKGLKYTHQNLKLEVQKVSITDISAFKILMQNTLHIDHLKVESARLNYYTSPVEHDGTQTSSGKKELPIDIEIEEIELLNTGFSVFKEDLKMPSIESNMNMTLTGVGVHKIKQLSEILPLIETFKLSDLKYRFESDRYHIDVPQITFSRKEASALIKGITVLPQYEKYKFAHVVGHEIDWINASIDSIFIEVQSLNSVSRDNYIEKLFIYHPHLEIFRDKRLPFPENQRPKLLKELLASEQASFAIDSIFIIDGDITYEEQVKEASLPGKVTFSGLDGVFVNLYSYNKKNKKRPRLTAQCKLFDATTLYADISFPSKKNQPTIVKGIVEPTDLTVFNQMLEHVAFTRIKSGKLKELNFNFSYGTQKSTGEMIFDYSNLQIEFLQKENGKASGIVNEVKGFVANTFVVNSNNGKNGKIRIGNIAYDRNIEKSMFNFWWKSILTGFKSSIGIKPAEEKKEPSH